jgi:hypothetical protein
VFKNKIIASSIALMTTLFGVLPASAAEYFFEVADYGSASHVLNANGFPNNGTSVNLYVKGLGPTWDPQQRWIPIKPDSNTEVSPFAERFRLKNKDGSNKCLNFYASGTNSNKPNTYDCTNNDIGQVFSTLQPIGSSGGRNVYHLKLSYDQQCIHAGSPTVSSSPTPLTRTTCNGQKELNFVVY